MDKVVHFEIPVDDEARARDFYASAFDWELKTVGMGGGTTITPRTPIPGMGAFAYFKDGEGNTLGLWETA